MKWKEQIQRSIQTVEDLARFGSINPAEREALKRVTQKYPMRITPYYARLINWGDSQDPLRKIVVPSLEEIVKLASGDNNDPYGEEENTILPGLEHKYDSTALLLVSDVCAGYCRQCFRKPFVSQVQDDNRGVLTPQNYEKAADYIRKHPEIDDVLITGGEPLMLCNASLDNLLTILVKVPNVKKIRIGTKILAYLPQRVTEDTQLQEIMRRHAQEKELRFIVHYNHPRELAEESKKALKFLKGNGIRMYNQTPLLRGINDGVSILRNLFVELDNSGVISYYLFERMTQKGTAHLSVPTREGFGIFAEAMQGLEGTAQTAKYVRPTKHGKLQILDVYERDGKSYARASYLKTSRDYSGPKSFEMEVK